MRPSNIKHQTSNLGFGWPWRTPTWRFDNAGGAGGGGGTGAAGGAGAGGTAGTGGTGAGGGGGQPVPLAGADGVLSEKWLEHEKIGAEVRKNQSLAAIKTVPELADRVFNLEKALGKKRAVVPTDPANKAEMDEYFALAGWPKEGPDKYPQVQPPADMPKELKGDPELAKNWRSWCHEVRVTPEQFSFLSEKIMGWNIASHKAGEADKVQKHETAVAAMKTDLGPRYDYTVQLGNTAAAASLTEAQLAHARQQGWLDDPVYLAQMAWFGEAVSPDRLHANSGGRTDTTGIERQIGELEASDAYRKPENPRHDAVTQQVLQLRQQLINAQSGR